MRLRHLEAAAKIPLAANVTRTGTEKCRSENSDKYRVPFDPPPLADESVHDKRIIAGEFFRRRARGKYRQRAFGRIAERAAAIRTPRA